MPGCSGFCFVFLEKADMLFMVTVCEYMLYTYQIMYSFIAIISFLALMCSVSCQSVFAVILQ